MLIGKYKDTLRNLALIFAKCFIDGFLQSLSVEQLALVLQVVNPVLTQ